MVARSTFIAQYVLTFDLSINKSKFCNLKLCFRGAVPRLGDGDADAVQQKCSTNHNTASDGVATNLSAADKRFSCVLCGYSTDRNSHYVRHVKTHTDVKPYQCERCGKSFKLETYLRKHRCAVKASAASGDVLEDLLGAAVSSEMRPGADSTATPADAEPNICACGAVFENLADLTSHVCIDLIADL